MTQSMPAALDHPDSSKVVAIVTGSTLVAETRDRPLAYRMRERILAWIDHQQSQAAGSKDSAVQLEPVVCSDLWYLNDRVLAERPAIAIGEPAANAATSLFSSRLPTAFVIEGSLRVHLDPEFLDLRAALWGVHAAATAAAVDLFAERYLGEFLEAVM